MEPEKDSELQTYGAAGDNRNARLHAHMVALRLNTLPRPRSMDSDVAHLRRDTRLAMLTALTKLPLRDEVDTLFCCGGGGGGG